jgi:MFS family permease
MEEKEMQTMMEDLYKESQEDTIGAMASEFYSRRMLTTTIYVWVMSLLYIAGSVICGILFFQTDSTQYQLMYATLFLICVGAIFLLKVYAWEIIHRNSIKREIKRLEIRIAQLTRLIQEQHDKRDDDSVNVIT